MKKRYVSISKTLRPKNLPILKIVMLTVKTYNLEKTICFSNPSTPTENNKRTNAMSTKHVNRFFPISSFSSSWEALDQSDCYFPSLSCRRKRRTRRTKNCRCHCCCCRCRPRRTTTRSCLSHCCRMSRRQSCLSHCCWSPRTWEHMPRRAPRNTRL